MPASDGSIEAAAELGLDVRGHASTPVDDELLRRADRIYCMSASHLRALTSRHPEYAAKAALLRPDGDEIEDPYGGSLDDYRRARDQIAAAVAARAPEWVSLLANGP
jgi:protein-tyrosine-phosphatase